MNADDAVTECDPPRQAHSGGAAGGGPGDDFHARREELRAAFCAQLPARLAALRSDFDSLLGTLGSDAWPSAGLPALRRLELGLHTLKGSSGTFGLTAVCDLASSADALVKAALAGSEPVDQPLLARLAGLLDALAAAGGAEVAPPAADRFSFEPLPPVPGGVLVPDTGPGQSAGPRRPRRVLVCDDDADLVSRLVNQLACFGYEAHGLASLAQLQQAVRAQPPDALIMDVMFPEGIHAGPQTMDRLAEDLGLRIPCIFVSVRDDFAARLWAVKAGGSAYCTKPLRITEIVEFLDALTNPAPPPPVHVLVVDDDPQTGAMHALLLEQAGMRTQVTANPAEVPELLSRFNADLVLMDLYMPECSGPELARVLRQMPGHLSLPIIYLSSETDPDRQLQAMQVGVDGFMTKPVDPQRLVIEVSLRAERMRTLHALMVRDGLTGLFNHNTILQFLQLSVANARRDHKPLAVAMIDVDRFKQVNDTYGHPAGDQVLVALSRGLKVRLRECDVVGRYGGEEFAVVLVGTDGPTARAVLEQLRISFSGLQFFAGQQSFTCTFSAGIATLPEYDSADALVQAADAALYQAKHGGRNRVELAPAPGVGR